MGYNQSFKTNASPLTKIVGSQATETCLEFFLFYYPNKIFIVVIIYDYHRAVGFLFLF